MGAKTEFANSMIYNIMEPEAAFDFMKKDFPIRTLTDVLCEAVQKKHLNENPAKITPKETRELLRKALTNIGLPEENIKKIDYWLPLNQSERENQVKSISKDSAMQIAFALKMTLDEAELFLGRCWLDALYLRDVRDVIYRCGLKYGFSYHIVKNMLDEFSKLKRPELYQYSTDAKLDKKFGKKFSVDSITKVLSKKLGECNITCPKDVVVFINEHSNFFGLYHQRTYEKFIKLYNQIKGDEWHQSPDMEIGHLSHVDMFDLLTLGLKANKDPAVGLKEVVSFHIKKNIPTRTELSSIRNKTPKKVTKVIPEVSRNILILTWLISEDGWADIFTGKPYISPEIALQNHVQALQNSILFEYGFPPIDPRHPFDWVIMNSLYVAHSLRKGNDNPDAKERLNNFTLNLQTLFEYMYPEGDG